VRVPPRLRLAILVGAVGVVVLFQPATASAERKRVGIPRFVGPQETLIRRKVMQAVRANDYDVVKPTQLEGAAATLGASFDSNGGFKMVAKELAISAFVTGEVAKKKVKLTVRSGADGSVSAQETFSGPNLNKIAADIAATFWSRLGAAVDHGKTPSGAKKPGKVPITDAPDDGDDAADGAAAATAGAAEADDRASKRAAETAAPAAGDEAGGPKPRRSILRKDEEAEADRGPPAAGGPLPRALDVSIGPRFFFRSLSYNQPAPGTVINSYEPRLLAAAGLALDWYPAAHTSSGFVSNLGLDVNIEQGFGISSKAPNGQSFATNVHEYDGAARLRLPFSPGLEGGVIVGYGQHAFTFSGAGIDTLRLPNTTYQYIRAGVALRAALTDKISLTLGGAYRQVLSTGQIETDYFPHLTVAGLDGNLGVGYRIASAFEARAGVDLRRYFYSMHSVAADTYKVGGAVDQTIAFSLSLAYLLGGDAAGAARTSGGDSGDSGGGDSTSGGRGDDAKGGSGGDGDTDVKIKPKRGKASRKLKMESDSPPEE
jgi:hypothetical protein